MIYPGLRDAIGVHDESPSHPMSKVFGRGLTTPNLSSSKLESFRDPINCFTHEPVIDASVGDQYNVRAHRVGKFSDLLGFVKIPRIAVSVDRDEGVAKAFRGG